RLRLAASAYLAEAALERRLGGKLRKREQLPSRRHGREYNPAYQPPEHEGSHGEARVLQRPRRALSRPAAGVVVACPCGEVYELRPEYAGRLLEYPSCGRHIRAGYLASAPRPPAPGVDPPSTATCSCCASASSRS